MGYYIQGPALGKVNHLVDNHGAIIATAPVKKLSEVNEDVAVVIVVNNGPFEAAAYAYCQSELDVFNHYDGRPTTTLLMMKSKVHELTGYRS